MYGEMYCEVGLCPNVAMRLPVWLLLYMVMVIFSPGDLLLSIYDNKSGVFLIGMPSSAVMISP